MQLAIKAIKEYDDALFKAANEYVDPIKATRPYIYNTARKRTNDEARKYLEGSSVKRRYDRFAGALYHLDKSNNTFK